MLIAAMAAAWTWLDALGDRAYQMMLTGVSHTITDHVFSFQTTLMRHCNSQSPISATRATADASDHSSHSAADQPLSRASQA